MVQAVMGAMGGGRWSFARSPVTHLLLCGPVPNRPQTGTSPQPGGWGPLAYTVGEPTPSSPAAWTPV